MDIAFVLQTEGIGIVCTQAYRIASDKSVAIICIQFGVSFPSRHEMGSHSSMVGKSKRKQERSRKIFLRRNQQSVHGRQRLCNPHACFAAYSVLRACQ